MKWSKLKIAMVVCFILALLLSCGEGEPQPTPLPLPQVYETANTRIDQLQATITALPR